MYRYVGKLARLRALVVTLIALSIMAGVLVGCSGVSHDEPSTKGVSEHAASTASATSAGSTKLSASVNSTKSAASEGTASSASGKPAISAASSEPVASTFGLSDVAPYAGKPSVEVNGGMPFFNDSDKARDAFEEYAPLDPLGRCGSAFALISRETMPTEERGSIGMVKPSGWKTARYDWIDGLYLFNRCHLIGYQLAGENDNERNLITGTRSMNVQGMQPYEDRIASYVRGTGNHVLYRSTPVFDGDELVARGVLLEALSVEDDGAGIRFCTWCYNVEPGVEIDYTTGESRATGEISIESGAGGAVATAGGAAAAVSDAATTEVSATDRAAPSEAVETASPEASVSDAGTTTETTGAPATPEAANVRTYVLNTNTHKFHYPNCSSVGDMAEHNKQYVESTRDEIIALGYEPCGRCNP